MSQSTSASTSGLFSRLGRTLTSRLYSARDQFQSNRSKSNRLNQSNANQSNDLIDLNTISAIISPFESYIVSLQKLLIWEDPSASMVALTTFNFIYWFTVYMNRTLFSSICLVAFSVKLYIFWTDVIWPDISIPPPPDADREGWTPLHPQVMSAPEISRHLKVYIEKFIFFSQTCWNFRAENRGVFCIIVSLTMLTLAYLGTKFSGAVIVYFILMSLALAPGVFLYLLPETWKDQLRDFVQNHIQDHTDGPRSKSLSTLSSSDSSSLELVSKESSSLDKINQSNQVPLNDTMASLPSKTSSSPSSPPPASSSSSSASLLEQFLKQSIATLETTALEQLQHPIGRMINDQLEQLSFLSRSSSTSSAVVNQKPSNDNNLQGASPSSPSSPSASKNPSRKSSQSSVQSAGIRFIASHFSSRTSSSSDLNEFELVSESECESDNLKRK